MSLAKREYYAHPRNDFWRILQKLAGVSGGYKNKCRGLKANRIALWDVVKTCERRGSSDTRIKKPVPNDLEGFLLRHPQINAIYLNGRKAESLYRKHFSGKIALRAGYLPSSSPAHAVSKIRGQVSPECSTRKS